MFLFNMIVIVAGVCIPNSNEEDRDRESMRDHRQIGDGIIGSCCCFAVRKSYLCVRRCVRVGTLLM